MDSIDKRLPPKMKAYEIQKNNDFLIKLKRELHRINSDILIKNNLW